MLEALKISIMEFISSGTTTLSKSTTIPRKTSDATVTEQALVSFFLAGFLPLYF